MSVDFSSTTVKNINNDKIKKNIEEKNEKNNSDFVEVIDINNDKVKRMRFTMDINKIKEK